MNGDAIIKERLQSLCNDYARIDDAQVHGVLKQRSGDFDAFAEAVVAYLGRE